MNIAIITCQNYKCSEAIGVMKEQTRDLTVKNLNNVNYDPSLSYHNIVLEHDKDLDKFKTYRGYIENFYEKNDLVGRFNLDTTCDRNATKVLTSFVLSGSRDFISSFSSRDEIVDYFRAGGEFLRQEYPYMHIVDFRVHFDEKGLPHAHCSFIPVYEKENGDRCLNITQQQKSKDYFRGFQDRYYEYMRERYPDKDLQRTDPNRDHEKKLSVKEYKEFKDFQREFRERAEHIKDKIDRLDVLEKQVNDRDEDLAKYKDYLNRVDNYCNREGITIYQYEKECFYAERGYNNFPQPEHYNPQRQIEREEHTKDINREYERER